MLILNLPIRHPGLPLRRFLRENEHASEPPATLHLRVGLSESQPPEWPGRWIDLDDILTLFASYQPRHCRTTRSSSGSPAGATAPKSLSSPWSRSTAPMVLRVCLGVLRDPHDAEDAFQATFLVHSALKPARSAKHRARAARRDRPGRVANPCQVQITRACHHERLSRRGRSIGRERRGALPAALPEFMRESIGLSRRNTGCPSSCA